MTAHGTDHPFFVGNGISDRVFQAVQNKNTVAWLIIALLVHNAAFFVDHGFSLPVVSVEGNGKCRLFPFSCLPECNGTRDGFVGQNKVRLSHGCIVGLTKEDLMYPKRIKGEHEQDGENEAPGVGDGTFHDEGNIGPETEHGNQPQRREDADYGDPSSAQGKELPLLHGIEFGFFVIVIHINTSSVTKGDIQIVYKIPADLSAKMGWDPFLGVLSREIS